MKSGVENGIRNGENKVNQGLEGSFHYPSKKKYGMFAYVMRLAFVKKIKVMIRLCYEKILSSYLFMVNYTT